jgi:hypothetical protein
LHKILDVDAMLESMSWLQYCRWYLHYLREPWGSAPENWYSSQMLWAALVNVIPKGKMPKPDELVFNLLRKNVSELDEINAMKRGVRSLTKDNKNAKANK